MRNTGFYIFLLFFNAYSLVSKAQTWSAVGTGVNNRVLALAIYDSNLVAGGGFTTANGNTAKGVAAWDGTSWSALGTGTNGGSVLSLKVDNNELVIGGTSISAGGTTTSTGIAKWDGNNWYSIGGPGGFAFPGFVAALELFNNELYAGGDFIVAQGSITVNNIAKWDGTTWSRVLATGANAGGTNGVVEALKVYNGDLYVGGNFTTIGSSSYNSVAKWDGAAYTTLGSGMNNGVYELIVFNGELYAGGNFTTAGGSPANYIAKWDGTNWLPLGSGLNGYVGALGVYHGELHVGGEFTMAGGAPARHVAKWDGTNWSALGAGLDTTVEAMAVYNDELYVGGFFRVLNGSPGDFIAKWSSPVGLKELNVSDQISVYPNPANDVITIKHKNKIEAVSLVDVYGKMYDTTLNEKNEIDVSEMTEGMYVLQIKTKEGVGVKKILVQR